ncbi:hypothetical protein [Pantoea ananatis]
MAPVVSEVMLTLVINGAL